MNKTLTLLLAAAFVTGCTPRGSGRTGDDDDDDSAIADDDDATGDDDDATGDDDDATGDDDDATGDDDDATGDDDDATGDDDDATGDDDDATGDDDDATGDDDDSTSAGPAAGDVIVSEILINPGAVDDTQGEWFEILNLTSATIDLSGWVLSDRDTDSLVISPTAALLLPPGDYVVLGRSDVPGTNGGAPVDWAYGTAFTMANGDDEIVLTAPGGLEVFALEYTSSFPNPSGIATQLSGATLTWPASQDLVGSWCLASDAGAGTFGMGDTGTPGQQNPSCS